MYTCCRRSKHSSPGVFNVLSHRWGHNPSVRVPAACSHWDGAGHLHTPAGLHPDISCGLRHDPPVCLTVARQAATSQPTARVAWQHLHAPHLIFKVCRVALLLMLEVQSPQWCVQRSSHCDHSRDQQVRCRLLCWGGGTLLPFESAWPAMSDSEALHGHHSPGPWFFRCANTAERAPQQGTALQSRAVALQAARQARQNHTLATCQLYVCRVD